MEELLEIGISEDTKTKGVCAQVAKHAGVKFTVVANSSGAMVHASCVDGSKGDKFCREHNWMAISLPEGEFQS